ncbi:MAG: hypothetical protein R6V62_02030 [Candidatus Fermentibacteraceae bacterium]
MRVAPSYRWTVWGSSYLSEVEGVSYEYGETRVLFPETALPSFGLGIDGRITSSIDATVGGYWNNYGPVYVAPPEGGNPMNRNGNLLMLELVARRTLEGFFLGAGIEIHHYRETWSDPFTGQELSADSTCIGPKAELGTIFHIPFGALKFTMATVFPGFADIIGSVGVSLLIP